MPTALYLDTSAVLRATFEAGTTPALEAKIRQAAVLITSRLSLVESARAVHRLRALDALHLATFLHARESIDELELVTTDERLSAAANMANMD